VQQILAAQGFDAYRALPSDTLETALARNGIQEVGGSTPLSSTSKIKDFSIHEPRRIGALSAFCLLHRLKRSAPLGLGKRDGMTTQLDQGRYLR
jgi:hypothetical protein